MARTKEEIRATIDSELTGLNLSTSLAAIWDLIVSAVVSAIYVFELIIDLFKADIEDKIAKKRIGSLTWYAERAKEFQINDNVIFNEDGTISYPAINEENQIIAFAIATEAGGIVFVKVAKLNGSLLEELTTEELLQFNTYMQKIMVVGTDLETVSLPPDSIKTEMEIFYDPIYSQAEIQTNLDAALLEFKTNKTDSVFVKNEFIEMLRDVEGINDVSITLLQGIQGANVENIVRNYEVIAGYFNFDTTNVYTLTADV